MTSYHSSNCFYKKSIICHCRPTKGERFSLCPVDGSTRRILDKIGVVDHVMQLKIILKMKLEDSLLLALNS